jgi:hypothetical protein
MDFTTHLDQKLNSTEGSGTSCPILCGLHRVERRILRVADFPNLLVVNTCILPPSRTAVIQNWTTAERSETASGALAGDAVGLSLISTMYQYYHNCYML